MNIKKEFRVKVKYLTWKKYYLIIRENDFQLKKEKAKSIRTYSLSNAGVLDPSENNSLKILVTSPIYKKVIQPYSLEDKQQILLNLEKIVRKKTADSVFSSGYYQYKKEIAKTDEKDPYNALLFKLNTYQVLSDEMRGKLAKFKTTIKEKLSGSLSTDFISIYNEMNTIILEMKKQFDKIIASINKYFTDGNVEYINDEDSSSDDEKKINEKTSKNNDINIISNSLSDFNEPSYDFEKRLQLNKNIKCPQNILKEMISTLSKKGSSPVYFNEPISMTQKHCEKFYYIDLLTKASQIENDKPLQMCYISAFIIGEIFTNIGRFLKPFTPILGETYEYYNNSKKFRYHAESVKHNPPITAFCGETPDFTLYGDTFNDYSFKILKGSLDLELKNKIHIIFKKNNVHYTYNTPIVSVKGLLKPPMYNDYIGTTIIEDINDSSLKLELNFVEQSWSQPVLGGFEGKVVNDEDKIEYLIGGNWLQEIYITDSDGNNKNVLLSLEQENEYLKNNLENYKLPSYSCNLNYLEKNLELNLPKNDSRFRLDMKFLEIGDDLKKAQLYKDAYEQKQRTEILDEGHKILFFEEKINIENDGSYYVPNGKYWEMKKNKTLKLNGNSDIFSVDKYVLFFVEKEKKDDINKNKDIENNNDVKIKNDY